MWLAEHHFTTPNWSLTDVRTRVPSQMILFLRNLGLMTGEKESQRHGQLLLFIQMTTESRHCAELVKVPTPETSIVSKHSPHGKIRLSKIA